LKKIGVAKKSTLEKSRRPDFHLLKKPRINTASQRGRALGPPVAK
jgi:hypothetical protein